MSSENRAKSAQSNGIQYLVENEELSDSFTLSRSSNAVQIHTGSRNGCQRTSVESSNDARLRELLVQMIRRLTPNPTLREDLLQEAMIHLWRTETRRPGQTRSWYLQSCRFHLQHYLNGGRSIDSTKRWRDQMPFTEHSEHIPDPSEQADSGDSIFTCVNAREILSLLTPHLSPQEKEVLVCLAEGLGAREIGRRLHLSHTMAIRHRRKIAMLLKRLELQSTENPQLVHSNDSPVNNGHAKKKRSQVPDAKGNT
jgi:RNA polymerase sigma factor (sigma-70 family)